MRSLLWRIVLAVICLVLVWALVPPLVHLLGFPLNSDAEQVLRACVAGIAVLYIIWGPAPPSPLAP